MSPTTPSPRKRPGLVRLVIATLALAAAAVCTFTGSAGAVAKGWLPLGSGLVPNGPFSPFVSAMVSVGGLTYMGGGFGEADGVPANFVAAWDGTTFHSLGDPATEGSTDIINALATDGTAIFTGSQAGVLKYDPGTSTWTDLGAPAPFNVRALAWANVNGTFSLVAGGFLPGGLCGLKYYDGSAWGALADPTRSGANCELNSLVAYGDYLLIGGAFDQIDSAPYASLAVYHGTDGTLSGFIGSGGAGVHDSAQPDLVGRVNALRVVTGGPIVIGGLFDDANGTPANGLAAAYGPGFFVLGDTTNVWSPRSEVLALAEVNGVVAIGGRFSRTGDSMNIGALGSDGQWVTGYFGGGVDDAVYSIADNTTLGEVYVGGSYTHPSDSLTFTPLDGMAGLARYGDKPVPPAISSLSVTGTPHVGELLTAHVTTTGDPAPAVDLQWIRCDRALAPGAPAMGNVVQTKGALPTGCIAIAGATDTTYRLTVTDLGAYVGVWAIAQNVAGSAIGGEVMPTQVLAPVTTTTTPATTTPATTEPATTTTVPDFVLPATGRDSGSIGWTALVLVLVGTALLAVRRRSV